MARLFPSELPRRDSRIPLSERRVFEALADLDDDWTVVHSLQYLGARSGSLRRIESGEIDFLLLHQEFGALTIEVKGGGIAVRENRWFSTDEDGLEHPIQNPFDVGSDGARSVLKAIQEVVPAGRTHNSSNHCVVFSAMAKAEGFSLYGPPEITFGKPELTDIAAAVKRAINYFGQKPRWTPQEYKAIRRKIIPNKKLSGASYDRLLGILEDLDRLTEQQKVVVRTLASGPGVYVITGGAGTGKTLLGMSHAIRVVERGQKALFVCSNQFLARFLQRGRPVLAESVAHGLEIDSVRAPINRIITDYRRTQGVEKPGPVPEREREQLFLEAITHLGLDDQFDCLILDEAQDIDKRDREMLEYLLRPPSEGGQLIIMGDPNQQLGLRRIDSALDYPGALERTLDVNCRNTKEVAEVAHEFTSSSVETQDAISGIKIRRFTHKGDLLDAVIKESEYIQAEFSPDDMVILTINHPSDIAPEPGFFRERKMNAKRIRDFQGQEADAVVAVITKGSLTQTFPYERFRQSPPQTKNPQIRDAALSDLQRVNNSYDSYCESSVETKVAEFRRALLAEDPDGEYLERRVDEFRRAKQDEFTPTFRNPLLQREWNRIQTKSWRIILYSMMTRARVVLSIVADEATWKYINESAADLDDLDSYFDDVD